MKGAFVEFTDEKFIRQNVHLAKSSQKARMMALRVVIKLLRPFSIDQSKNRTRTPSVVLIVVQKCGYI